jgi:hypothetical protein
MDGLEKREELNLINEMRVAQLEQDLQICE